MSDDLGSQRFTRAAPDPLLPVPASTEVLAHVVSLHRRSALHACWCPCRDVVVIVCHDCEVALYAEVERGAWCEHAVEAASKLPWRWMVRP